MATLLEPVRLEGSAARPGVLKFRDCGKRFAREPVAGFA